MYVCLSVCLPACLSVSLFVCLPACLSVRLSVCTPACLPGWLAVCMYVSRGQMPGRLPVDSLPIAQIKWMDEIGLD